MALEFYSGTIILLTTAIIFLTYLLMRARKEISKIRESHEGLQHDIRSMNVKYGKSWEHFVPFMPEFEKIACKENSVFLGMPVDFIAFDDDAVKFIEVKTGKSKLNENQQRIKKLIDEKKVKWFDLRYTKD